MQGMKIMALLLALGLCAAPPAARAGDDHRWGAGWDDAPTVRYCFAGGWQAGLLFAPQRGDDLVARSFLDDTVAYSEIPFDRDSWTGRLGLNLSRPILHESPFTLAIFSQVEYQWLRSDETVEDYDHDEWRYSRTEHEVDSWTFIVGLRPSWELLETATVEFTFGYSIYRDDGLSTISRWNWDPEGEYRFAQKYDGGNFSTWGGWEGLSSLSFLFWF